LRTRLLGVGGALGAAALAISTLFVTAGAAQAVGTGNLVVNIVDQYGRPVAGVLQAYATPSGDQATEDPAPGGSPFPFGSTHTFTGIDEGGYAFVSLTPWSGLECAGAVPCGFASPPSLYLPVVTVSAGGAAAYTFHVTLPTVAGTPAVGSPLNVAFGPGYSAVSSYLGIIGGGGPSTQQWTGNGADLAGATTTSYTPAPADSTKQVAIRLMPSAGQQYLFGSYGGSVTPYTTPPVTVAKFTPAKTSTKLQVPGSIHAGSRVSLKVKVTSKETFGGKPAGRVTVTIGQLKVQKTIKNGSVFITLPNLKAGTYRISVGYSGSEYFAKSKAKTSITVHA